eukprot:scaffold122331_cov69-Phaeocystis_antarctica.AAC.1
MSTTPRWSSETLTGQFLARQRLVVQCVVVTAKVLGTHPAIDGVLGLLQRDHALVLRTLVGLA